MVYSDVRDKNCLDSLSSLYSVLDKVGNLLFFKALQRSQLQVFPLIVAGAFFLCLLNFPVLAVQDFIAGPYEKILQDIVDGTFNVASLAILCCMSYNFGIIFNKNDSGTYISPSLYIVVAMSCFFVVQGGVSISSITEITSMSNGIVQAYFVASVSSYLLHKIVSLRFRFSVPGIGYDFFSMEILSLVPACVAIIIFFSIIKKLILLAGVTGFNELLQYHVQILAGSSESEFFTGAIFTFVSQVLWFFGCHGPNILLPVESEIFVKNLAENAANINMGIAPVNILTKGFMDAFSLMGGSGLTLSLLAAIFLKSRDSGTRKIALFALPVCLFNINEPLLFGIPLVLNPVYAVPFILTPLLIYCVTYAATVVDLIPIVNESFHWTTPIFLSGYSATGSWIGVVVQFLIIALGVCLYIPFVSLSDRVIARQYDRGIKKILEAARQDGSRDGARCLGLPGFEGFVARTLANDLRRALRNEEQLYLVYQPQVDPDAGRVVGAEALLRWKHPSYGNIPPEVIVALSEDLDCVEDLTCFVLKESCNQFSVWQERLGSDLFVSVNFPPSLFNDGQLDKKVMDCVDSSAIPARCLEIEITESVAMSSGAGALANIDSLRSRGVRISIDDFGMGHTSLRYLRELPIDKVKIDRSLTFGSRDDVNMHIVGSILDLCRNIDMKVVIEGVEDEEQLSCFRQMGAACFQGYYFSRPLSGEDCLCFMDGWDARRCD